MMKFSRTKFVVVALAIVLIGGGAAVYYWTQRSDTSQVTEDTGFRGGGGKFRGHGATGYW